MLLMVVANHFARLFWSGTYFSSFILYSMGVS